MAAHPIAVAPREIGAHQPVFIVEIGFRGSQNGILWLACEKSFASALTKRLLDGDDEVSDEMANDTVKELMNMISGAVLVDRFGLDARFDLVQSATCRGDPSLVEYWSEQTFLYEIEEHLIALAVRHLSKNPVKEERHHGID